MARKGTDGSLLTSLPWTLVALSFAVLPHTPYLPIWITAVYIGCATTRIVIERRRWRLPPTWLRMVLAVGCFIGVFASFDSRISGVGPGSALLAVMAALKLLETRERRDQFVLLFISIFLIMSSLLREQYLWSLPYLIAGLLVTMTAWLQMSMVRGGGIKLAFSTSARLVAYATPLMLAMWILFPRIATPFWAVPIDTSSGVTGLSDRMSPGDISSLSQSDAVAFRVYFEGAAPQPQQRYFRGLVLHYFNGRAWRGNEPIPMGTRDSWPIEYRGDPIRYKVSMEATRQHWVFALDLPYEWSLERTFMGNQQQLARAQPIDQRVEYDAVSYPEFRINVEMNSFTRSRYLRLPDDSNPRTRELAQQIRNAEGDDQSVIDAIMRRFNQEDYFYTLEPPPLGSNSVDEFVFDTRRGFCEHYASAFAVLMRAAGIPSRVVLGYQGGELNPLGDDYMIVRQSDAHAWTEVWLEGQGWTRVDPTSAVAPERIMTGMSGAMLAGTGSEWGLAVPSMLIHRLTLTWDVLNAKWNEWILAYGPDNQTSLMERLGMEDPNFRKLLLTLMAVVAILLAAITGLLVLRNRPPRPDRAALLYATFCRKTGITPLRGEPPLDYAHRVGSETGNMREILEITKRYLRLRYGDSEPRDMEELGLAVRRFAVNQ